MSLPLPSSPLLSSPLLRRHWFSLGLSAIFLGALGLRLWGLDRINQLVFDEVYYVKYGVSYLTQQPVFDAHPPLGKYLIALGVWLGENILFRGAEIRNPAAELDLSPLSYRWLNGAVGALIPPLVAGVALQLTGRRRLAILAGLFAALDGFLLVESRLALLHVYLVAFGMLGQWCFLQAWRSQNSADRSTPWQWLLNAGLSFGACVSIKWNGLGYWLIPMLFWLGATGILKIGSGASHWDEKQQRSHSTSAREMRQPWGSRPLISGWEPRQFLSGAICLVLIPILFYAVLWLPHLRYQTEANFATVHQQMLGFHRGMDDEAAAAHPYCSAWWSWPLLLRPMAYFFEKSADQQWRYSLYALGNPILWWLTTGAIALLCAALIATFWQQWRFRGAAEPFEELLQSSPLLLPRSDRWIAIYLIGNYAANWLPWIIVKRCTFIYHHLGAMSFGLIAVAFWCDRWLRTGSPRTWRYPLVWHWGAVAIVALTVAAFLFWLPLYLGLPLAERGFYLRFWLPSWI